MTWFTKIFKKRTKVISKKIHEFPCASDNCLVRVSCTQACDKLIINQEKLLEEFLKYNCCSDCGSIKFIEGPSGGMATNVKCVGCGHWFNFALPISIERIHINSNGIFL